MARALALRRMVPSRHLKELQEKTMTGDSDIRVGSFGIFFQTVKDSFQQSQPIVSVVAIGDRGDESIRALKHHPEKHPTKHHFCGEIKRQYSPCRIMDSCKGA